MKKLALIPIVALCLASCGQQKQPDIYKDAIETEIIRLVGPDAKVSFTTFERIDSTTFGKELEYRHGLIQTRRNQNLKLMEKYKKQGMPTNMEKKAKSAALDAEVLKGIEALRERMAAADSLDIIAYYDYHVAGEAKSSEGTTTFPNHFACVAVDGTLLNFTDNPRFLHKSIGKVIPGYHTVLKRNSASEDDSEE